MADSTGSRHKQESGDQKKKAWSLAEGTTLVKVYPTEDQRARWEKKAIEMGFTRKAGKRGAAKLSEFLKNTIDLFVAGEQTGALTPPEEVEQLRARIANLESEMKLLQEQNNQLKRREIGESEQRILERLSAEKVKGLTELVQELSDTQAEATYETLQRLIQKGVVEYVHPHDGYRLRLKRGTK